MSKNSKAPKPRIQVQLDSEVYMAFRDLSEATGRSMSAIAAEILTEASPIVSKFSRLMMDMEFDYNAGLKEMAEMAMLAALEAKQHSIEFEEMASD